MNAAKPEDRLSVIRRRMGKVPTEPGVYRWLSADGSVLYVGKAKNLKNRMKTYVQAAGKKSAWTAIMVRQIQDFEVTVVRSELEAFILESTLIKELRPKYNIMLKDDKGYVYVCVTLEEPYPRIEVVRQIGSDDARYFGPFMGAKNTYQTLDMLDGILKFRACRKSLDTLNHPTAPESLSGGTPCLDYQIGKCCGLCIGLVSATEYRERIDEVVRFFRGNFTSVKRKAEEQMKLAAADKKFERAARIRDVIRFIEDLEQRQIVFDTSGENADVFGIARSHGKIQMVLLRERDGKLIEQVNFALKGEADSDAEAVAQFLPQYYSETRDIPDAVIVPEAFEEMSLLETWLTERKGKSVRIHVPERGKKSKLIEMAARNALQKVEQQFAAWEAETKKVEDALVELAELLTLSEPPRRIEGYDISHLGGTATVGSMVVFVNGKAKREHYRSFNMQSVKEGVIDDYKSLAETLRRRLKYLSQSKKQEEAALAARGLLVGRARKGDQVTIEKIVAENAPMLGPEAIEYKNFIVARRGEEIVAMAQLSLYAPKVPAIRTVWVAGSERGHRLGQHLIRRLLRDIDKGKVYALIPPELEEYYGELGFRPVLKGPDQLEALLDKFLKKDATNIRGLIVMYEVKEHKADESFLSVPDLILIDGGKGQLSAAVDVLQGMNLAIPLAGLAKHEEEIFVPGNSEPLIVNQGSQARFLLQRLRDEAHRFANAKREARLGNSMFQSKLDQVPGIGPKTRSSLLKRFGSADAVLAAADEELKKELTVPQLQALREQFPPQPPHPL